MISLAVVFVLGVFAQQTFADPPEAIVGGTPANPGEFPHQISLRIGYDHICGGSIIGDDIILTAAHCCYGIVKPGNAYVYTGTNSITGGTAYPVKSCIIHPNYNPNTISNDVALIILTKSIIFGRYVKKIPLTSSPPVNGTACQLSGWGLTRPRGSPSPVLLKMNQAIITQNSCADSLRNVAGSQITQGNVCAFNQRGIGACQGDSGGPFICNGVQYGITSWGIPCALGMPDVYTSVYYYLYWIKQYVKNIY